jgi:hypothetical protein
MRWDYGDAFTSVGMIIIAKAFQGCGYGARLVDALLDSVGSRTVVLNATRDAFELYRRRGFNCTGVLNQHQGIPVLTSPDLNRASIVSADASDLPLIMTLDQDGMGMPRIELLKRLARVGRLFLHSFADISNGYAVCRAFGRGYVIGPVVAPCLENACSLIDTAMSELPGEFVRVDTNANSGLSPWLEARGLTRVDTASTMIRGEAPQPSGEARVFALCSQSLG